MSTRFRTYPRPSAPGPRSLTTRDRALLRILNRSKAATCGQLSELTRAHLRKIQQRTRGLWQAGYLERTALAPPASGRSPNAYRLAAPARRRLGYHDRRVAGINELQHRLDTVEAVCALARPCGPDRYPLQAWLTESMAAGLLGPAPLPDSILVLQLATATRMGTSKTSSTTLDARLRRLMLSICNLPSDLALWFACIGTSASHRDQHGTIRPPLEGGYRRSCKTRRLVHPTRVAGCRS
ncbi:MAG: hypothetical protein H0W81_06720 [Chloroflexi bacterium]|nr:hypothetical protein [Chloroflexota bacterium]